MSFNVKKTILVGLALTFFMACGNQNRRLCDEDECHESCAAGGHTTGICENGECVCLGGGDGDADTDGDGDGDTDMDGDNDAEGNSCDGVDCSGHGTCVSEGSGA